MNTKINNKGFIIQSILLIISISLILFGIYYIAKQGTQFTDKDGKIVDPIKNDSSIKVISPNGGERWDIKSVHQISWTKEGIASTTLIDIFLNNNNNCNKESENCLSDIVLDKNITLDTVYNWIVGTDEIDNIVPLGSYRIKICTAGTDICDYSDKEFTIASSTLLLKTCPSKKIINRMPSIDNGNDNEDDLPSDYFIVEEQRMEIRDFDLNWISANCKVEEEIVN